MIWGTKNETAKQWFMAIIVSMCEKTSRHWAGKLRGKSLCLLPMGVIEISNAKKSLTKFNSYPMAIEKFKKTHFCVNDYMFVIVIYYSLWDTDIFLNSGRCFNIYYSLWDADIFLNSVRCFKTNEKWEWV